MITTTSSTRSTTTTTSPVILQSVQTTTSTSTASPTPSEVYYKEVDNADARFTPGPVYYKDIEFVTTPSIYFTPSTTAVTSSSTTTEGWRPRVDENVPSDRQSYDSPTPNPTVQGIDTDVAPASPSYASPETEANQPSDTPTYAPSSPQPTLDSYGAPKAEPYISDSYGAPKGEAIKNPPTSGGASITQGQKRSLRPQYRNPALGPLFNGVHKVRSIVEDQMQRLRRERNNPLLRSAAVIIPYAVTLL